MVWKASDGTSAWTINRGGFENSLFNEIVLKPDGKGVQLTRVDANHNVFYRCSKQVLCVDQG